MFYQAFELYYIKTICKSVETIYANISDAAKRYNMTVGGNDDYVAGANIAGFEKVVDAMLAQGVC